jgi:hypothetical protein
MDMLSGLRDKVQQNSSTDRKASIGSLAMPSESYWMETTNDVVTAASEQWMSHQGRQSFVKHRIYFSTEPATSSQQP